MAYYKCQNCKKVFSIDILVDPAPYNTSDYPPMLCPSCGRLSKCVPFSVYFLGKIVKVFDY